jgi:hypothetical protein
MGKSTISMAINDFPYVGNFIIPTDELQLFHGLIQDFSAARQTHQDAIELGQTPLPVLFHLFWF